MTVAADERVDRLPQQLRGYDPEAVDVVLREVEAARRLLERECAELRERAHELRRELEERDELDRRIREVLVGAQREADELRARTAREVEELRREAPAAGAVIDERAIEEEAARIRAEIDRLRLLQTEVRAAARVLLLEALRRLDEPSAEPTAQEAPAAEGAEEAGQIAKAGEGEAVEEPRPAGTVAAAAAEPDDTVDLRPVPPAPPLEPAAVPPEAVRVPPRSRRTTWGSAALAVGILAVGAGVAALVWQLRADEPTVTSPTPAATTQETAPGGGQSEQPAGGAPAGETPATTEEAPPAETTPAETAGATTAAGGAQAETPPAAALTVDLVLRARGGDCWLSVRRGSASGELLYEGFLFEGEARRFEARRLWLRLGNPSNLVARANGRPLDLPAGTADVLVTPDGSRTLALG